MLRAGALAGCLGTSLEAPLPDGDSYGGAMAHIASSTRLNASICRSSIQPVVTVPTQTIFAGVR